MGNLRREHGRRRIPAPDRGPDRSALAHIRHGALRRRPQPDDHLFRIEPGCGADRRYHGTRASPPGPRRAVRHGNRDLCLESRVHPAGTAQKDRRHYAEGYRRMDGLRRRQLSAARRADSDVHDTRSLGRTDSGRARRRGIGADGDKAWMSGRRPKPEAIRQTRRRTDRLPPHRGKLSPTASRPRKRTRRPRIGQTRRKLPLPPNRTDRKAHSGLPPRLPKRPEDHCGPPSSRPCCGDWRPC